LGSAKNAVRQITITGEPLSERYPAKNYIIFDKTFAEDAENAEVDDSVAQNSVTSTLGGIDGIIIA
jgi:hypothetical protein